MGIEPLGAFASYLEIGKVESTPDIGNDTAPGRDRVRGRAVARQVGGMGRQSAPTLAGALYQPNRRGELRL
jgi:hypothetical protein